MGAWCGIDVEYVSPVIVVVLLFPESKIGLLTPNIHC
uniref:Uncharacterized protein n=1 Tax=Rhizophora mucronata TaxID=61149 RepID=A0A2P2NG10_RHIMU